MSITPDVLLSVGQQRDGFAVRRVTPLTNLRAVAYELEHLKTAARLLHVHSFDTDNLFSVTFPTPPPDDTGLPHILEHAVLGGSRRFPVKDPFFEMVKMSMATFINAMTASDHTMYPVSSNVRQDFYNLAEVYWDAVFHPTLTEMTFKREGHHLEFADKRNPASDLIIKGIVYNEMKGVYSSPNSLVGRHSFSSLFPATPYGRDSGGDPRYIPDLTYENFRQFHRALYHPSNARIFLYGDIPTTDHLAFLRERLEAFDRRDPGVSLPPQPRWPAPRVQSEPYPIGKDDPTERKTYFTINWMVGESSDVVEELAFEALDLILLGNQAAPLRKAIIDSKLGEDLTHSGFGSGVLQNTFHIGIKGSEPDRREAFEKLVLDTLGMIAHSEITPARVEAALQQLAYQYLEITSMFPLNLMYRATSKWLYGQDPLLLLRADEHLAELRRRYQADPEMFARLIRSSLIANPHRLTLSLVPDRDAAARQEAEQTARLAQLKSHLTPTQQQLIVEETLELERLQNAPNTAEALATLPQLAVRDLPPKPKHIPTTVEKLSGGVELLRNDVPANGVNYLQLDFDLAGMSEELMLYLPLYGDCIRKMGTESMDFIRMAERVAANTGGVDFSTMVNSHLIDPNRCMRRARLSIKFLDGKAAEALRVLEDFLFDLDPRDVNRLGDVLLQARVRQRTSIVERGMSIALSHAARSLNVESRFSEILGGLPQIRLIQPLAEHFEQRRDQVITKLLGIREFLKNSRRLVASFTGTPSVHSQVRATLEQWIQRLPAQPIVELLPALPAVSQPSREGLAAPMQVAFCTQVLPAPHSSHPDAPLLMVGARLVSMEYVLEEVRFKGTAYGGGCGYSGTNRAWSFHSYRDPWVTRTLNVYAAALDYVRQAAWSQPDVDRAIIGTAKEGERPIRPAEATGTALWRHVMGDTPQRREQRHAALLSAGSGQVKRAVMETLEANLSRAAVCVVSSRDKLQTANTESPDRPLSIEEIIT